MRAQDRQPGELSLDPRPPSAVGRPDDPLDMAEVSRCYAIVAPALEYDRKHYIVDPTKYVGNVPAKTYTDCSDYLIRSIPALFKEIDRLRDRLNHRERTGGVISVEAARSMGESIRQASEPLEHPLDRASFEEAVDRARDLLGIAIRPTVFWLSDNTFEGRLTVDPDVAFAALRKGTGTGTEPCR